MPAIMIQGTGSNVGKSLLVAGLCRAAKLRGLSVAPFKPQNMSNNAAVTIDGGEIGRAQALQARASGLDPHTDMNPVLLKPESETGSQVVVQGHRIATVKAHDYAALKPSLMAPVLDSFHRLSTAHELVIVEGAGSPSEVNLRTNDIANMGFSRASDTPVILVGDIDRGGVIAQIVGTKAVLDPTDSDMIAGFIINKFRGDVSLFEEGYRLIETLTSWRGFGTLPFFADSFRLPSEDALDIPRINGTGATRIAVPVLSRIANFDDIDPLAQEPGVSLTMVHAGEPIPQADLIIIPGSKSTRADLAYLRTQGWDIDIAAHIRRGGYVLGICGGYQMLGQTIDDPEGIEGPAGRTQGLGHINVTTTMTGNKRLTRTQALHMQSGLTIDGYEIHIGRTTGPDCTRPFATIGTTPDGAISANGHIMGSYLHGMFASDQFRAAFLASLGAASSTLSYDKKIEETLDALAAHIEGHLDLTGILALAR
ncbi:MAG: cobyric acid synthase [Rhodobacteraceae bacterium]|nr:cobyric acid synthase [Paracoccaceae bacterium]